MVGHTTLGAQQSHLIPLPSLHGGDGPSFPGLDPPSDIFTCKSVVGIKTGDSSVVIGYQVYDFTCTWLTEHFINQSHIYSGLIGKVHDVSTKQLPT